MFLVQTHKLLIKNYEFNPIATIEWPFYKQGILLAVINAIADINTDCAICSKKKKYNTLLTFLLNSNSINKHYLVTMSNDRIDRNELITNRNYFEVLQSNMIYSIVNNISDEAICKNYVTRMAKCLVYLSRYADIVNIRRFKNDIMLFSAYGADINSIVFVLFDDGKTPGIYKVLKMLLELGLCANITNAFNESLIYLAAEVGQIDVVKLLLDYGADVNK